MIATESVSEARDTLLDGRERAKSESRGLGKETACSMLPACGRPHSIFPLITCFLLPSRFLFEGYLSRVQGVAFETPRAWPQKTHDGRRPARRPSLTLALCKASVPCVLISASLECVFFVSMRQHTNLRLLRLFLWYCLFSYKSAAVTDRVGLGVTFLQSDLSHPLPAS